MRVVIRLFVALVSLVPLVAPRGRTTFSPAVDPEMLPCGRPRIILDRQRRRHPPRNGDYGEVESRLHRQMHRGF